MEKFNKIAHNYVFHINEDIYFSYLPIDAILLQSVDETAMAYEGNYYIYNGDYRKEIENFKGKTNKEIIKEFLDLDGEIGFRSNDFNNLEKE